MRLWEKRRGLSVYERGNKKSTIENKTVENDQNGATITEDKKQERGRLRERKQKRGTREM